MENPPKRDTNSVREIAYRAIHAAPDGRVGYVELLAEILLIAAWEDGHDINRLASDAVARATGN